MTRQASTDEEATGIRVLLVEPDLQIAEAFKTWFSESGCEVYVVASREQAFPLLSEKDFDLVMLDLMDPRLGGLSTLEQIHEMKPRAEIVVAASRFDAELMDRALDIGPLTVLRRPIAKEDVQRLAATHKQMTERRAAETERPVDQDRTPERAAPSSERGVSKDRQGASEGLLQQDI
jgi:DNA-binding NtrC family response regulator